MVPAENQFLKKVYLEIGFDKTLKFFPILPYFISTSQISLSPFCISTYGTHPIFIIIETIFVLSILSMFTSIMLTLANHVNKGELHFVSESAMN